jgi:hypothetical protein
MYVACQVLNHTVISPASLRTMFDRVISLGLFKGSAEPSAPIQAPAPAEPQHEALNIEALDTSTREGLRRTHELLNDAWVAEWLPLAESWVTSLQKGFNFSPTPDELRFISQWIKNRNLNPLDPRTYDAARFMMCSSGRWNPLTRMTNVEQVNREIESLSLHNMTHDQRRTLNVRIEQAKRADAARFNQ